MIERLKNGILDFFDELSARRIRRRQSRARRLEHTAVKGTMRNVIVVHPREDIFQEAVFILRDDYFQKSGVSREALLRQARAAAEEYAVSVAPPRARRSFPAAELAALLVLAAAALLILFITGVI